MRCTTRTMYYLNIVYLVQHRAVVVVRTMGHVRDVLHLDVSTVFPHYAGALHDGTKGDGGGTQQRLLYICSRALG